MRSLFVLTLALFIVFIVLSIAQRERNKQVARTEYAFSILSKASDLTKTTAWNYDSTRFADSYFTSDQAEISYPVSKFYNETSDHQEEIRQAVADKIQSPGSSSVTFRFTLRDDAYDKVQKYILNRSMELTYADLVKIEYIKNTKP